MITLKRILLVEDKAKDVEHRFRMAVGIYDWGRHPIF
jgi:hypothetical protein